MFDLKAFFKYAFGMEVSGMPKSIIITPFFQKGFFTDLADSIKIFQGSIFQTILLKRGSVTIALLRLGKATYLAGDAVIGLKATSLKRLFFLNSCCSLEGGDIGDIVVPKGVFAGEEFSGFHLSKESRKDLIESARYIRPDRSFEKEVFSFFEDRSASGQMIRGDNFTTGSVTAEDADMISLLRAKKVVSIDMELSKILTAAEASGVRAASVMVVSDSFDGKKFFQSFTKEQRTVYNNSCEKVCRMIFDLLERNGKG